MGKTVKPKLGKSSVSNCYKLLLNCYQIVSQFRPNCYLDRDRPDFKDFLHNFLNFRYSKNSHILKKKRLSNPLNFFDTSSDFKKLLPRFSVKLFIGKLVYKWK